MDDLGDHGEGLQSPRAQFFREQEIGEAAQIPFIRDRQYGAEAVKVDILRPYVMMARHLQMADLAKGEFGTVARHQK